MKLQVIAIAAPEHLCGKKDSIVNSFDPVSLFNALRIAAFAADEGRGAWGDSNWADGYLKRRQSCMLMYSLDDLPGLDKLLELEKPNLVLIGAMSVCMRGALECASYIRARMGDQCVIVLGGRHVSESMYKDESNRVVHHRSSPLQLVSNEELEDVFDLVVGGEAEDLIFRLGESLGRKKFEGRCDRKRLMLDVSDASGNWVAGTINRSKEIFTLSSKYGRIEKATLPSITKLFGATSRFTVFGGLHTAHVYSDTGAGCVFDCDFCSERLSVVGRPENISGAPFSLYRQLGEAANSIFLEYRETQSSAFVEDSTFLLGKRSNIRTFCELMERDNLPVRFGAQFTVDQIISRPEELARLSAVGLSYVFLGIETLDPYSIGGMNKDTSAKLSSWASRVEEACDLLSSCGIRIGFALLFGLGETHLSRIRLLNFIEKINCSVEASVVVSMNWAVQHPLKGLDNGANYKYLKWPVLEVHMMDLFHRFGEASTEYPMLHVGKPKYEEVFEVVCRSRELLSL
ncbi:B12-binding domain/radical SAM domain-containing protein [Pseudomonas marginalis]|uniref:B12-binding domain/radical SAM domain-containing protein n=1 Tax=Pseudomonas TaxID=286 RepID=UPI00389B30B3